jgi:DNA-directed RNA polymerase specialized sigma24 family protein
VSRNYDRRSVEALLPTVWDELAAYGLRADDVPDPGMPKAKANPAHSNTLYAMLADIRQAWKRADIPQVERQALLLRFGLGWEYDEIGYNQGVVKSAAHYRVERGVGRMTAWLNGDIYCEDYDVLVDPSVMV